MSQHSTSPDHSGHSAAEHRLVSLDERMRLFWERDKRLRQRLKWFNTPDGKKTTTKSRRPSMLQAQICSLCSMKSNQRK